MARFNQTMDQIPPNERNYDTSLRYMILENPATYVPTTFSVMYRYDPKLPPVKNSLSGDKSRFNFTIGPLSPILTTPDEQYAIGLYTPEMASNYEEQIQYPWHEQYPFLGYELYDWSDPSYFGENATMLLGTRMPKVPVANTVTSVSFIIIGTLADVQNSIHSLYFIFNPTPTPTPIPPTSTPIPPTITPTPIPGDITGPSGTPDGVVDIHDYNKLIGDFGKTNSPGDIDGNGTVDIYDYNTLIGNFGRRQ